MRTITKKAIETIGEQAKDDWILEPEKHAESLPAEAALLRKRLQSSPVKIQAQRYKRHDKRAGVAQNQYQHYSTRRIFSAAFAAISGALFLYLNTPSNMPEWFAAGQGVFFLVLIVINIAFFAAAAFYSFQLKNSTSYNDWKEQRAEAENARIKYFEVVIAAPQTPYEADADSPEFMALQLEYFRRYMLDMQYHYYQGRSQQHQQKAQRSVFYGALLTGIVATGSAISGLGEHDLTSGLRNVVALFSVIVPSVLVMQAQFASLNEDRNTIRRYEHTYGELENAQMDLDRVRFDASEGQRQALTDFVTKIHSTLAAEHEAWLLKREKPEV